MSLEIVLPPTPELDKKALIKDKAQAIGEFVDLFLAERGWSIGKPHVHDEDCVGWDFDRNRYNPADYDARCSLAEGEFVACDVPLPQLIADFFHIDMDKMADELEVILAQMQKANS